MRLLVRLGAVLLCLHATACITAAHTQTADTVGKGNLQVAAAPMLAMLGGGDLNNLSIGFSGGARAQVLHGLTEDLDIGGRLTYGQLLLPSDFESPKIVFGLGAELLLKKQLVRSDGLRLALAPSLGFHRTFYVQDSESALGLNGLTARLPLLAGIPMGDNQLVLGLELSETFFFGNTIFGRGSGQPSEDRSTSHALNAVATVGLAIRLSDSLSLMPELGLAYTVLGDTPPETPNFNGEGAVYPQFTVGILFDGR